MTEGKTKGTKRQKSRRKKGGGGKQRIKKKKNWSEIFGTIFTSWNKTKTQEKQRVSIQY